MTSGTADEIAVYGHVRGRLDAGQPVNLTNAGHGPRAIGAAVRLDEKTVKTALAGLVLRQWLERQQGTGYSLGPNAPPLDALPAIEPARRAAHRASTLELPPELAARIGMVGGDDGPDPTTPLDWALLWSRRGLHLFPVERFLGTPLVPQWYRAATNERAQIVEWWTAWPDADIAAVPEKSGCFAIVTASDQGGAASLGELEDEHGELPTVHRYRNRWGDEHLLCRGSALTSHHKLGCGLHVLGAGHYVYVPDSWAPCQVWDRRGAAA